MAVFAVTSQSRRWKYDDYCVSKLLKLSRFFVQGSHTTGKTGKVREIEYCAPGPGKVLELDKCGQSPGKVREKETGAVPHF